MNNTNELYLEIIKDLHAIHNNMKHSIHSYFKKFDLTPPQGMLIFTLNANGKMKISDISKKLGLSNSTVSGIVDRLEGLRMVERIRSEEDRRVVYVQLTQEMSENLLSHNEVFETLLIDSLKEESKETVSNIAESLKTLSQCIKKNGQGENVC